MRMVLAATRVFPPPSAGEGTLRSRGGEGSSVSGKGAPLSRPSLTRGPPSPAGGGGEPADVVRSLPGASR
ncbi:hypothetical protein FV225_15380 [Methylobacterium sp. WL93]|nr:hypothetical protein FV225_15380 [Methylobacterium sp. WL93]